MYSTMKKRVSILVFHFAILRKYYVELQWRNEKSNVVFRFYLVSLLVYLHAVVVVVCRLGSAGMEWDGMERMLPYYEEKKTKKSN